MTQASNDKQQLVPTVDAIREQAGQKPQEILTDSGYCSEANLQYLEKKKIEGFIATDRESYRGRQQSQPAGAASPGSDAGGPHAPETADQGRGHNLLQAQNGGRAGVWAD